MEHAAGGTRPGRVRVVVAAVGGDDDARVVARLLRDAGHEVIWSGTDQAPERIVATAIQEDADAIGVCADRPEPGLLDRVAALLADRDATDIVVLGDRAGIVRWATGSSSG